MLKCKRNPKECSVIGAQIYKNQVRAQFEVLSTAANLKKCSDLKFNFTFTNFQNGLLNIQPVKKNQKSNSEIQLSCMNKNKISNSRWPIYRENLLSAPQKQTHAQPTRENFTILHVKKRYGPWKNCKKLAWYFFFGPIKNSIIALKVVFTDTFDFQEKNNTAQI